jgi:hypothetical protein
MDGTNGNASKQQFRVEVHERIIGSPVVVLNVGGLVIQFDVPGAIQFSQAVLDGAKMASAKMIQQKHIENQVRAGG